jgi:RNA polymerase sigma-70 factor (ECF subfamily)
VDRLRPIEDAELRATREARDAIEELYRAHGRRVRSICRFLLRDGGEAEDAAQQVFLSAFVALAKGTVPREPGAWLATIARRECWARARSLPAVAAAREVVDGTRDDPSTEVARRVELAEVWEAIDGLPAAQREALLLREVRGLSYDELADDLRLSRPSVRSLLSRARRTLRVQLGRSAGALSGASWLDWLTRLFAGGSNPAVSTAGRGAAVGLGAVAITGGAAVLPSLTPHAQHAITHHASAARSVPRPNVTAPSAPEGAAPAIAPATPRVVEVAPRVQRHQVSPAPSRSADHGERGRPVAEHRHGGPGTTSVISRGSAKRGPSDGSGGPSVTVAASPSSGSGRLAEATSPTSESRGSAGAASGSSGSGTHGGGDVVDRARAPDHASPDSSAGPGRSGSTGSSGAPDTSGHARVVSAPVDPVVTPDSSSGEGSNASDGSSGEGSGGSDGPPPVAPDRSGSGSRPEGSSGSGGSSG